MLQNPVRDTVCPRSLAELENPDGFLNLFKVGKLGFAGRNHEIRPRLRVNHLNNCRDRRVGHWLKLSLQTVGKGFGFLRV
jgi:hypothetical protein